MPSERELRQIAKEEVVQVIQSGKWAKYLKHKIPAGVVVYAIGGKEGYHATTDLYWAACDPGINHPRINILAYYRVSNVPNPNKGAPNTADIHLDGGKDDLHRVIAFGDDSEEFGIRVFGNILEGPGAI